MEEIRAECAKRSLLNFTTYTYPAYEANWHHRALCRYLDRFAFGDITRLMVFMPPRHGKSELVSRRLPAYIFGRDPDASIIATSYGADLAARMNRDVQRIIDSPSYEVLFPETTLFGQMVRTTAKGSYLRNSDIFEIVGHKGAYTCAGVGGAITGMGCNYGIIDDPYKNRQDAESATVRNTVWDWYTSTFYTRLEKGARVLITLTRWHEDDLAGRLLKLAQSDPMADQWTVITFPAVADDVLCQDDPRQTGEALWPGKYTELDLQKTKATIGSYEWAALYQQRPSSREGNMLNRAWWQYYSKRPDKFDVVIQSWDMAFKDNTTSDFVVGQVWGRTGADKYLLDQVRDRMDFTTTLRAVRTLSDKWPQATAKLIEDKANGTAVMNTLQRRISGLIAVEPYGSKEARAAAVSPQIESGNVFLPSPDIAPWISEFIEECAAFPKGINDDQVDAMTQALARLEGARPVDERTKGLFGEASLYA